MEAMTSKANDPSWKIFAPMQKIRENAKDFTTVKLKAMSKNNIANAHSSAKFSLI